MMDGWAWFWTICGILVALRIAYNIYNRVYGITGRHHTHYWYDDFPPERGSVWYVDGVWYTQSRFNGRQPRRFDERSNPMDVEPEIEWVEVPPRRRGIEREVEY